MLDPQKVSRKFEGIWIPKEIYFNNDLNWTEKILLLEITSLDNKDGCFASNAYLAGFLGISETAISTKITKLKSLGFVTQETFDGRHRVLHGCLKGSLKENLKADFKKTSKQTLRKVKGSPKENLKDSNKENTIVIKKENNSPAKAGGYKNLKIQLSSISETSEQRKAKRPRGLTKSEIMVLHTYKKFIYSGCSEKTKTIIEGIPRAMKLFKKVFHNEGDKKLLEAIEKYSRENNYINNHKERLMWFAPKNFFSLSFIEDFLVPLVFNQTEHGSDSEDGYTEEELREIEKTNKENIRRWEEKNARLRASEGRM